ncbi:salicylate synthase [Streptomyces kronopolitis]|uniref:salicylate synthase n=1 Tax=Streptomyces kronopolitis TaxID=1612435 RepID=UPI0020BF4836|nr:salicylate synthase [Streptomyces kronopolitis]MCL6296881.1 salicylate synthase [Streptomyces kronopolitis]
MKVHYRTSVVESAREPLDIAVGLAASGLFDTTVIHEAADEWSVAGGVAAEVIVDAKSIRCTSLGVTREEPWFGEPLTAVQKFLADLPISDWTAYGWCAFELAHAIAGMTLEEGTLLHLVIPETEIRLTGSRILLRSLESGALAAAEDMLARIAADSVPAESLPVQVDLESNAETYRLSVAALIEEIRAGKLQKAILSREIPVGTEIDFPASYRRGRLANTPARSFLLDMGGLRCFGFSPESVVEVSADRRVSSQPLAGTRALTGDPHLDHKLREDLLSDPKELHEHAISVKVAVDELVGPCKPDSVFVEEYMSVKERGSVQHLASRVVGQMPEEASPWDAFAAVFPAVTASGVPKRAAYQAIQRHEQNRRGLYAGAVLKVAEDGAMDAALVLRSVYAQGGRAWLRAGAGIVERSHPDRELEETREKLRCVATSLLACAKGTGTTASGTGTVRTGSHD